MKYDLQNINASLETLAPCGGIRRFILNRAHELELTGTVRRSAGKDVLLVIEGKNDQINAMEDSLAGLISQGIIETYDKTHEKAVLRRQFQAFRILSDMIYKKSHNNKNGIQTGAYSGNEWEVASTQSLNDSSL